MEEIISCKEAKEKGLTFYFTGKPCKRGHIAKKRVSNRGCIECKKISGKIYDSKPERKKYKAELEKKARAEGKRKESENKRANTPKRKAWEKNYRQLPHVKEKVRIANQNYLSIAGNREDKNKKDYQRKKKKLKDNPTFKYIENARRRISLAYKEAGKTKTDSTINLLGCKKTTFKNHLEKQFRDKMTHENHGKLWEIDHYIPIDWFVKNNKEIELAFHYLNCQPLLKKEHYKKRTALPKNYEVRLKKIKESISSKKLHRNLL